METLFCGVCDMSWVHALFIVPALSGMLLAALTAILKLGYTYSYFKKGCHSKLSILEPKGTVGTVIMSDNTPAKVAIVWPWHYDDPALYIM